MRAVEPHAVGVRLHLRARHREQRDGGAAAVEHVGELPHLDEAELRRREHDDVDLVDAFAIARLQRPDVGLADLVAPQRLPGADDVVQPLRLRRDADHVEQRDRAVARERRAEMLHLVGAGHAVDAGERGDLPVVAGEASDDAAERAPVAEVARREASRRSRASPARRASR